MITRTELERIAQLRSDNGILSAYIKVEPRLMYHPDQALRKFKGAMKRFGRAHDNERWLPVVEREKDRVLQFLDRWQPSARGLAIFSSIPDEIWEVVELEVIVPTFISVNSTTNTAVLARVRDEHPRFVVVIVQRDNAVIYTSQQRIRREEADIESNVPGWHDQGGWSQARYQRHIEFHAEQHLKKVVDELQNLYYDQPFRRMVVGGTDETVTDFLRMLPEPISKRVIGEFSVDFKHATEEETLTEARRLLHEDERRLELELVGRVIDAVEARGQAVLGIEAALRALIEGRVDTLVVADGFEKEGYECEDCDYFAAGAAPRRCPACGGVVEQVPDIVDRAVERAYATDAHVEIVFDEAKERLLEKGGIGAVLRF